MGSRIRHGLLIAGLAVVARDAVAQAADSLPEGVTPAMVAAGKKFFQGEGLCLACHGPAGKGGIGPDLTDRQWLHGRQFVDIVRTVLAGVGADSSRTGQIMPPKGGSTLDDGQVRAVAAYVWTLSQPKPR